MSAIILFLVIFGVLFLALLFDLATSRDAARGGERPGFRR